MKTERRQKKMKSWQPPRFWGEQDRRIQFKVLLIMSWLLLLGSLSHSLKGQASCTMACSDRLEVPLGVDCETRLTAGTAFTDDGADCPGQKNLILRQGQMVITQAVDVIEIDLGAYIGSELSFTVIDDDTDVSCTTILEIVDNTSPSIMCPDTMIACTGDTSVAAIGFPIIEDNCDPNLDLTYSDAVMDSDCNDTGIRVVTRTWTLTDASGNGAACTQNIVVERPSLDDIDFPSNVVLSCNMADASPDSTGYPLIDDVRVQTSSPCGLTVTYQDDTTMTCGGLGTVIAREWFVLRKCDGMSTTHEQIIEIKDGIAPSITCPDPFTVNTSVGDCTARVTLPIPTVTDNCDPNATFFVETSYGEMNIGPHRDVPIGTHSVRYVALDACGNNVECTTTFQVVDNEQPTAVCDDEVIVSLVDGGVAIARARSFDEGSLDNCIDQLYFKAIRSTTGACMDLNGDDNVGQTGIQEWYDDFVFFCCEDADADGVPVQLRVFTVNPGDGPVNPIRMQAGGDLFGKFNQCDLRVTIQDKIRPTITCPPPVTIDCRENPADLSIFGSPTVSKTCGFTLDSTVVEDLDNCGTGAIYRTFTATSDNEIDASCTQVITIENRIALVDSNITWPMDYETNVCGAAISPDDLPEGFAEPVIDYESCSLVAVSSNDERFDLSYPACYKVFRYWSVIDWCQFGESDEGRFDHRQVIKVQDEEAPVIACPSNITVGINNGSCNSAFVNVPAPTATDECSPTVDIFNDSEVGADDRTDASGTYPLGKTTVTFRASDRCGNTTECDVDITVVDDKAPAPLCIEGLVAALSQNNENEISATVTANIFLASSLNDDCHEEDDITISIRRAIENPTGPPLGQTSLTFSCEDIGMQEIELWVTDENNNSDYCTTHVEVQDNNSVCPMTTAMGFIAGSITTESGKEVENAVIEVVNTTPVATTTGVDGGFMVENIPFGQQVRVVPSKNDDLMNGVSTMDMIIMSKHILGLEPITSPYALIAADIDGSRSISTLDLIRLRKLVLNEADSFPNEIPSWRFIDADFRFPQGENPLRVDFPEIKDLESLTTANGNVGFIAVKIGDVNGSVKPNSILQGQGRTTNGDVVMRAQNHEFEAGETFTVDIYSEDLFNLIAFQFTLDYDERLVELLDFSPGNLPEMTRANFGLENRERGLITTSWNEQNTVLTIDKGTVCELTFRAIRSGDLYTALELNSDPTVAEAYNYNTDPMQVLLQIVDHSGTSVNNSDFKLYQNHPNPFQGYTKVGFVMPKRANAALTIYDMAGRKIYQQSGEFQKGYNEIELSSAKLPAHGLYYYRLESDEFNATRKMIYAITR